MTRARDRWVAMMATGCALLCVLLAAAAPCTADSLPDMFDRANGAYFDGDYELAAERYRELIDLGVVDADLTYNLATAEARAGHYGAAIQYFERTLWLRPGDADARAGLATSRTVLGRRRAEQQGEAEVSTDPPLSEGLFGGISIDTLAILSLLLSLAVFVALSAIFFTKREAARVGLSVGTVLLAVGLAVGLTGLATKSGWLSEGDPAVVLRDRVALREGPDPEHPIRHRAQEGQRAWILGEEEGAVLVSVEGVGRGYAARDSIGRIRP